MKTFKPMVKDALPNKYVLEMVKSHDPGHATFGGWPGSLTYFLIRNRLLEMDWFTHKYS